MATLPPSPAPRRTVQRQAPHTQSPPPRRRPKPSGSKPASRFATPLAARYRDRLPSVKDDESQVSGMDLDEESPYERTSKHESVLAKSAELTATFFAHLPAEVKQAFKNADFYRQAYTGDVDTVTGYALIASRETCFVWNYSQALTGTPTCYIFLCPQSGVYDPLCTPFHALVPYGLSREPGLILSSPSGEIRFWDSLGMGLAGGDNFASTSLDLEPGEEVTTLTRADPQTYIVSTSMGRLFRLTLTATGGSHHLIFHAFRRPQSALSLSRLLPSLWSLPDLQPEAGNINAVALGDEITSALGRDLWAIVDTRIQRWNVSVEGWEELILERDVLDITGRSVREAFSYAASDDAELDLELLDLKVESPKNLVLLVSFAGPEDDTAMDLGIPPRRIYTIIHLLQSLEAFTVTKIKNVPYQSTSSSGAPMHPRMQLMMNGQLTAVQFGDALTICARENDYMDRFELKSATDRTLGVGIINGESELLLLTATLMLKAYIDMDKVVRFDQRTGRANLIKSIMTQAILYGSNPENPLHFSFPPDIDEEALMSGAEQLSRAVMESDSEVVRPNHDFLSQMANRKERLSFLIKFINDNAVLTKMSQRSRQRLATDAEKLYAAHQVWLNHNDVLDPGQLQSVFYTAIYDYMRGTGEGQHEDYVRAFLRLKVENLGDLLPHVLEYVKRPSYEHNHANPNEIYQANWIILTVLQSAVQYREYNTGVYGITEPLINPWSGQPKIIEAVLELFRITTRLLEMPTTDPAVANYNNAPRSQLPELASVLFTCIRERLEWLDSPMNAEDTTAEREMQDLDSTFQQLRPDVLDTLRTHGFIDRAFKLAEDYRDFRTLVSLCHKEAIYPPQDNPHAARIQNYIEKFEDEFTTELYQWYIEHGELRTLFAREDDEYLDSYFSENPNTAVSWIHDLDKRRYSLASEALLSEAERATELAVRHVMLSVGKLSQLAQLHETDTTLNQNVLDAFHDGLDFVGVHETLLDDLKSSLASLRGRQSLEVQLDTITRSKASRLSQYRALQQVFKQLLRQLLQGKALSPEDIADILSLKDNADSLEDYTTALHILNHGNTIPSKRRLSAFRGVWRRIYLHDDWDMIRRTVNVSDAELNARFRNTALYVALRATTRTQPRLDGFISRPSEVLEVPDVSDIGLRWPGMSPDEVEAVRDDYERESEDVGGLKLESTFESIQQLLLEDGSWSHGR